MKPQILKLCCFLMIDNGYQVRGEKMYDKARRGESVELSPRRISIYQFDIERSLEDRYSYVHIG
jgi:tRNA U55 pseudouridine synthase TruB